MIAPVSSSFVARLRRRFFNWRLNREIFERMFPHLEREKNHGYPFASDEAMNDETQALDVQALLETVECRIRKLPKAYGECFRHIMHREIHERLRMYEEVAIRRTKPAHIDPRCVARRA